MLFHNIYWLKHDDGTEYVPLVGKPQHMFDSVVTPRADMKFGSKESMSKLLNGSRAHIGPWKKVSPPRQVFSLGNGSSLVGLQACAALDSGTSLVGHLVEPLGAGIGPCGWHR